MVNGFYTRENLYNIVHNPNSFIPPLFQFPGYWKWWVYSLWDDIKYWKWFFQKIFSSFLVISFCHILFAIDAWNESQENGIDYKFDNTENDYLEEFSDNNIFGERQLDKYTNSIRKNRNEIQQLVSIFFRVFSPFWLLIRWKIFEANVFLFKSESFSML